MDYQFRVRKSERGKRLNVFLYKKMGNWSHKQIKRAIDRKRVFVNGKNIFISGWNLKPGDRVQFNPQKSDYLGAPEPSRYQYIQVLFEDDSLLVTNKPPFVDYDSFVGQVNSYLKRQHSKKFYPYLGQMHRLDKETSGILMFTKKKMANVLADDFRDRRVRKYYLAIVSGRVEKDHGSIKKRLEKGKFSDGRKSRIANGKSGKESYTEYWVEERYNDATLLRILIGTGRTHQIRVHMAGMGHPVLGDKLYGNRTVELSSCRSVGLSDSTTEQKRDSTIKRQALHAHKIEFTHPITRKKMRLKAPIPEDIERLIDGLRGEV